MFDKKLSLRNRNKTLVGVFNDPDAILHTVEKLHGRGIEILDCYSPFPVHGLDRAMGLKRTNLTVGAFLAGTTGFSLALLMQWYMMVKDWPIIIGNKPYAGVPAWVPVLFEGTVLCTAFGMGAMFFIRNRMAHGIKPELLDERQTDDLLLVAIELKDGMNEQEIVDAYRNGGAIEVRRREHGVQTVI